MCDLIPVKTLSDTDSKILQTAQLRTTKWGRLPELSRTIKPPSQVPHATISNRGLVLFQKA